MTTIRSTRGQAALSNIRPSNANPALTHIDVGAWGEVDECATFVTADLLAALDAVPVAEANQSIEHELAQRDEAARLSHEYRNRAEKAEAGQRDLLEGNVRLSRDLARVSAELNRTRETYESELAESERCEREALDKATAIAAERDRLLATIDRINDVRRDFYEVRGDWADPQGAAALKVQMERAILGDPPFTLPTEAGARFTAQGKYDAIGQRTEFITFTGGTAPRYIVADKDEDVCYTGAGVMTHYEDHRLLDNNGAGPVTAEDIEGLDSSDVGADQ